MHITSSSCSSIHPCFNSQLLDRQERNLVWVLCQKGLPQNHIVEYLKIDTNKIADEESCEVGLTKGELWWPKLEPHPNLKRMA